jgi:hypothetical protein
MNLNNWLTEFEKKSCQLSVQTVKMLLKTNEVKLTLYLQNERL